MQGGGDSRVKPATLDIFSNGVRLYQGPIQQNFRFEGQQNAGEQLMNINFGLNKVSIDELQDVADALNLVGTEVSEVGSDGENDYIMIDSSIQGGPYTVSFDGNSKVAPFDITIEFYF